MRAVNQKVAFTKQERFRKEMERQEKEAEAAAAGLPVPAPADAEVRPSGASESMEFGQDSQRVPSAGNAPQGRPQQNLSNASANYPLSPINGSMNSNKNI